MTPDHPDSPAMERLLTSKGVSRGELPGLAAGILGLAASTAVHRPDPEAARLAQATVFSYGTWATALDLLDGHPHRGDLLAVVAQMAGLGCNPVTSVVEILDAMGGDGWMDRPGFRARLRRWLRL
jgi:hypothetical protein